jgi:two-component system OmpR family sensor kinase
MSADAGMPARFRLFGWLRRAVRRRFDAIALSTKVLAVTLALLMIGAAGMTLSIRELVGNYMLERTNTQLMDQAQLVYENIDLLRNKDSQQGSAGPTDYFLQMRDTKNKIVGDLLVPTLKDDVVSVPILPPNGSMGDVELDRPFTAPASVKVGEGPVSRATLMAAQAPWRVVALRWVAKLDDDTTRVGGVVYIGLSLSDQIDTVNTLTRYCAMVGIAIVLLGGVIASLLIQQTLSPLKRIEKTAAKIAAGDLSQRVPAAPENTEVGSLAASLNTMLARIERSFREQEKSTEKMKRFVSDASHELRTPLATIHGYSELYAMQRDMPGALERADESIAHIEASSSRMTVLVEDLLSLARLDEGRGIDITQQVRLTGLLADAADDLHALDPDRSITCGTLHLEPGSQGAMLCFEAVPLPGVTLTGDSSRLRQVVTNIVGNIHRYTPPDSPVEVALGVFPAAIDPLSLSHMVSDGTSLRHFLEAAEVGQSLNTGTNYAVVQVIDHGPGVADSSQSQIFERFYTADPSRARQKGGTGLGMSIAQSVVKAHHGFICASTTPGGGLTLTVALSAGNVPMPPHKDDAGARSKGKTKPRQKTERRARRNKEPKANKPASA